MISLREKQEGQMQRKCMEKMQEGRTVMALYSFTFNLNGGHSVYVCIIYRYTSVLALSVAPSVKITHFSSQSYADTRKALERWY